MLKANVNGLQIAYERRGSGRPLVLIHGYPLDHTIWDQVVPLLEPDFDLILPDLRGFGESSTIQLPYLLADLAADVGALLDSLSIGQAVVVGHSMGGYAALAFARAYAGRLLGLGLVATQVLSDNPEKKAERYQEAEHILAHGVGDVAEGMSIKVTENLELQARLKELMLRQRPEGLAWALRAMAERLDFSLLLPEFDFPVVLVHGLADKLIPVERAREVRDMVKQSYLIEIEGVGHMPMMEAPQVTAESLKVFS
jgi:pimeloyl-ACP methyl ester carboxylesterase